MSEKYARQQPAVCGKFAFGRYAAGCVSALMGTMTFDLLTLKLVCESHQRWGTLNLHSEFGHAKPSSSRVIRYVSDGRTDGQTDGQKQRLLPPSYGRGHNKFINFRMWNINVVVCSCCNNWIIISLVNIISFSLKWWTNKFVLNSGRKCFAVFNMQLQFWCSSKTLIKQT